MATLFLNTYLDGKQNADKFSKFCDIQGVAALIWKATVSNAESAKTHFFSTVIRIAAINKVIREAIKLSIKHLNRKELDGHEHVFNSDTH